MLLSPYLFMGWFKMEHTTMTQFIECSFLCVKLNSILRSEEKKSAHVFVCISRIMLGLDKNQSNQQKVHILRIPNW